MIYFQCKFTQYAMSLQFACLLHIYDSGDRYVLYYLLQKVKIREMNQLYLMCDCTILIFGLNVVFLDLCLYFKELSACL